MYIAKMMFKTMRVADITDEVETIAVLLYNIQYVRRTVSPTTHATLLLIPNQAFIRHTLDANHDITCGDLLE